MDNKKNLLIIAGVAVLVVALVAVIVLVGGKKQGGTNQAGGNKVQVAPTNLDVEKPIATPEEVAAAQPVIQGSSKVVDNVVVTPEGKPVKTDVQPGSPEAPQQTAPVAVEQLPENTIKLGASAEGFKPNTFEVKPGQLVNLSLTSTDGITHVFFFDDPSLSAVAIGVGPNETRAITFNAPKAGEYSFRCDVPGHAARGEVGKMIVK